MKNRRNALITMIALFACIALNIVITIVFLNNG